MDRTYGPNPDNIYPIPNIERLCFVKNTITRPNIIVGDYTYYDDPNNPDDFESNVLYHYEFLGDKLVIGRFCSIGTGVKFIMNGANHKLASFVNYPFGIFGQGWEAAIPRIEDLHLKGDTVVGNDVWIGYGATIMPGVNIGDGAIIGTQAMVTKDVEPYGVVAGNPARLVRRRFDDETITLLLKLKWWDWSIEEITNNLGALTNADITELRELGLY